MSDEQPARSKTSEIGFDSFIEDVFGLSFRGARTVRQLFVNPAKVAHAAREPDWSGQYTPSVRLVASLVALMMLLQYFWLGELSQNYQRILAAYEDLVAANPELPDARILTDQYIGYWTLAMPLGYFGGHLLGGWLLRVWGQGTGGFERIRLYFACIVPGLCFTILISVAMPLVSEERFYVFVAAISLITVILYGGTCFKALSEKFSGFGQVWRATLFAVFAFAMDLVISSVTGVLASFGYSIFGATGFELVT